MKLSITGDNPVERLVLALGLAPEPLMHTHMSFIRARAIMVATKLGVFEALAGGGLPAGRVAERCGTSPSATTKLLDALVGSAYLHSGDGVYSLTPLSRKWLLADAPQSIRDKVLFELVEWAMVEQLESFVRTGRALDLHRHESADTWGLYQRAMRALSGLAAPEIVRRTPVPARAETMLDIGGSHGFISVAMCRRHAGLRAVVLDLPEAIEHAAPLLAREGMGDRVVHRAGDARADDLGEQAWDVVYVSQLLHHFDGDTNRAFTARVARALKPGGVFIVLELVRPARPGATGQVGALLDLYFALTSQAGTWSIDEIAGWQRDAGLRVGRPIRLRTVPGAVEVVATK
jgi:SAM-dependent methyltransferase